VLSFAGSSRPAQIAKSPDGPWFPAARLKGLFAGDAPDIEAEAGPGIPTATKIAIGVCGTGALAAIAYLIWFVASRDDWEVNNLQRISRTLEETERLQKTDPRKAYEVYGDLLKEASKHPLRNEDVLKEMAQAEAARRELYKTIEPQLRAEEAERRRKLEEEARRAEALEAAAANARAEAERRKQQEERQQLEIEQRRSRAVVYRNPSEPARAALSVLKKLEARMEVGINYSAYGSVVGEAWGEVKIFVESEEGRKLQEFSELLVKAMDDYKLALDIWGKKIQYSSLYGDRADVEDLQQKCWSQASLRIRLAERMLDPAKVETALADAVAPAANENLRGALQAIQDKVLSR
jgi:flagellar biosynthesis GTPase FlhF